MILLRVQSAEALIQRTVKSGSFASRVALKLSPQTPCMGAMGLLHQVLPHREPPLTLLLVPTRNYDTCIPFIGSSVPLWDLRGGS